MARSTARTLAGAALVLGVVVVGYLVLFGSHGDERTFTAQVPAAENILKGQEINAGGRKVGEVVGIDPVDRGRSARIRMRITNRDYWPLARDSTLEIRYGGTVSFSSRYLLLRRGTDRQVLRTGQALPPGAVKVPVEVDHFIDQFPAATRRDLQRFLGKAAPVATQTRAPLRSLLRPQKAPLLLTGASKLASDLDEDEAALTTLVRSTSKVLGAANAANPDLRVLLDGFAQTATAIASRQADLRTTIDQFPAALRQTRTTLADAEVTLRRAGRFADELSPGVTQLRAFIPPLRTTLAQVRTTAPVATRALQLATGIAPLTSTLRLAENNVGLLRSFGQQSTKQLSCLRPYTPELAFFGSVWGDFTGLADSKDRLVHALVGHFAPAFSSSQAYSAGTAAKLFPGLRYAFPHPPGDLAAQPWFQPQCGITKDALDPDKDPESADFERRQAKG